MFAKVANPSMFAKVSQNRFFSSKMPAMAQAAARNVESAASKAQSTLGVLERVPGVGTIASAASRAIGGVKTIAHGVANVRGDAAQVTQRLAPTVARGVAQIGSAF